MRMRLGLAGLLGLVALLLALAGAPGGPLRPQLLRVSSPPGEVEVGLSGLELLVRFDAEGRAEASTFLATLNGADVTHQLVVADNGVHGQLHGLLDGENALELAVFGRARWPQGLWVEERRRLKIRFRRPLDLDRG